MTTNKPTYATHVWHPWRIEGDKLIVAGERTWKLPEKWQGRVLLGVDLFAPVDQLTPIESVELPPGFCRGLRITDLTRRLFATIDATPHVTWLINTAWPERVPELWPRCTRCKGNGRIEVLEHCHACKGKGMVPRRTNVILGTHFATQAEADRRIPELLKCSDLTPCLWAEARGVREAVSMSNFLQTCPQCFAGMKDITGDGGYDFFGIYENSRCEQCDGEGNQLGWITIVRSDESAAKVLCEECEEIPFWCDEPIDGQTHNELPSINT